MAALSRSCFIWSVSVPCVITWSIYFFVYYSEFLNPDFIFFSSILNEQNGAKRSNHRSSDVDTNLLGYFGNYILFCHQTFDKAEKRKGGE
jgi:hypothetical protein